MIFSLVKCTAAATFFWCHRRWPCPGHRLSGAPPPRADCPGSLLALTGPCVVAGPSYCCVFFSLCDWPCDAWGPSWDVSVSCVVRAWGGTMPVSMLWEHSATALTSPASAKPLARMWPTCPCLDLAYRHKRSACLWTAGVSPVLDFVLRPLVIATTPTRLLPRSFLVLFLLLLLFFPQLVPLAISLSLWRPDTKWAHDPPYVFFSHIRKETRKIPDRK